MMWEITAEYKGLYRKNFLPYNEMFLRIDIEQCCISSVADISTKA